MTTNNAINLSAAGVVSYNGAGVFTGSTLTQFAVLLGGATNAIASLGPLTDGQLVIGSTGVSPAASTLTAGTGITISNGAGTITISSSAAGFAWNSVAGTTQAIAEGNGYVNANAALTTFTLPATAVFGSIFAIVGQGAGLWTIAQNAGQTLILGSLASTTGVGGSVAATNANDSIEFLCTVADTTWTMRSSVGNLTVV